MSTSPDSFRNKKTLDHLYWLYHRREFVHPDPLEYLYHYPHLQDREVVALIASSLAFGRVAQILNSVSCVLEKMGASPLLFLLESSFSSLHSAFADFKHRFATGRDLAQLLWAARSIIDEHGSLYRFFLTGFTDKDDTVLPALCNFTNAFHDRFEWDWNGFLPSPHSGSACKRLNLFLRWMVRQDDVDPGGWSQIPPAKLIVPLDTHMHRMGLLLHLTTRKQADLQTALEITNAFRKIAPRDPVRYDFSLTRLGIRNDLNPRAFLGSCGFH